jgi:hypothetical protein
MFFRVYFGLIKKTGKSTEAAAEKQRSGKAKKQRREAKKRSKETGKTQKSRKAKKQGNIKKDTTEKQQHKIALQHHIMVTQDPSFSW